LSGELQIQSTEPREGPSIDDGGQAWVWTQQSFAGSLAKSAQLQVKGARFAVKKGVSILTDTSNGGNFNVFGVVSAAGEWPGSNKPVFPNKNYRLSFSATTGVGLGFVTQPEAKYECVMFTKAIVLTEGSDPVHGAGFQLKGVGSSWPVKILRPSP